MTAGPLPPDAEGVGTGRHRVAVAVCTRDRLATLRECLAGLGRQTLPHELIVVDSAPRREEARALAALHGARYLKVSRPGLSHARNRALEATAAEIVAFIDDDAAPDDRWLAALVAEFADARVAAASSHVVAPAEDGGWPAPDAGRPRPERRAVDRDTPGWFELAAFGGVCNGIVAVRRAAVLALGGFDERLGRGTPIGAGEENHLYLRLADAGHRVVFQPAAVALHPLGEQAGDAWRRTLLDASAATAYLTLLLCEWPGRRGLVLRYLAEAAAGKRRGWRAPGAAPRPPAWRNPDLVLAYLRGPLRYAAARWAAR